MTATHRYDVLIIGGFGHVGLPLGIALANAGLRVALYDKDVDKRPAIQAGRMPFLEHDAEPILKKVLGKTLHIAESLADVAKSESVIITIGTPIDEYLNPKLRPLLELAEQLLSCLRSGQCILLRSTVCPGTSECLQEFFKRHGCQIHLSYCPERIVQGHAIRELQKLPQIISGFSEEAVRCAEHLFKRLGVETIVVKVQEAELTKLFSNAWRYIQFAITNQFYMIATEYGADYERIYQAMTHNYERAQSFPKPGFAAGPCLLKDTLQLAAAYGNHFQLGNVAMMINEGLPNYVVGHLIKSQQVNLTGKHVGILGMAFKADSDDIRDSLSYKLVKVLKFHGAHVVCSDEYVKDATFVRKEQLLKICSIIIVGVPHFAYRELVFPPDKLVVDLWGVVPSRQTGLHELEKGQ